MRVLRLRAARRAGRRRHVRAPARHRRGRARRAAVLRRAARAHRPRAAPPACGRDTRPERVRGARRAGGAEARAERRGGRRRDPRRLAHVVAPLRVTRAGCRRAARRPGRARRDSQRRRGADALPVHERGGPRGRGRAGRHLHDLHGADRVLRAARGAAPQAARRAVRRRTEALQEPPCDRRGGVSRPRGSRTRACNGRRRTSPRRRGDTRSRASRTGHVGAAPRDG